VLRDPVTLSPASRSTVIAAADAASLVCRWNMA
jgi:hypothetical protein